MAAVFGSPPRWTLNSQLLLAIRAQDVSRASQLLRAGVDVDTRFAINAQKRPALCLSVENNDLAMVQLLLRLGASINQAECSGESPLHIACSRGYCPMVEVLLEQGRPNVNARTLQGTTALHEAASRGSCDLAEKLISYGADINLVDINGRSALHHATVSGHRSICTLLINSGAAAAVLDTTKNTPLHYAVARVGIDTSNIQMLIKKFPQALCITNKLGETPLIRAIRSGRSDIEEVLETILKLAMAIMPKLCCTMILGHRTARGHTPLHLAVLEKQIGCTRVLLAAGTEVDSRNHLGQTPLASAARDGTVGAVALLLAAGASTRIMAGNLVNVEPNHPEIVEMLKNASHEPLKLSGMCRRSLCRHFGLSGVLTEDLPFSWKDFLDFKTLDI